MKNTFLIIDASHLFYRSRFSVRGGDDSEKAGMCLHIIFNSINKAWRQHNATHVVFSFDGRNGWRKAVYPPYKAHRAAKNAAKTEKERDEDALYSAAFAEFKTYVTEKTNCTVLYNPVLESDDLIAGFIQTHPDDTHVVVSGDADFEQLLASNVILYNGVDDITTTNESVLDYRGKPIKDKKTGELIAPPNPEWSVFEKSMRGCTSDNIFSAYPGVRTKSTKKRIGLEEAFQDRHKKGFSWNAVMMHRWTDPDNIEHLVLDDYHRNVGLVDLSAQPDNIKFEIANTIYESCQPLARPQIGIYFLKFCGAYQLDKLSNMANDIVAYLKAEYTVC